jgi:putative ABC transport system substrate-binding protein
MRRREFIITVGSTLLWPLAALGQKSRSRVVGVLGFGSREGTQKGFAPVQRQLADMGFIEGRNLIVEYRWADSQEARLPELATELVQRQVDAIAVFAGQSIVAAKAATTSIPIIFFTGFDPVAAGFVASLNRPGGNATGISVLNIEVLTKRLEMLRELVPTAKLIAFLYSPTGLVTGTDLIGKTLQSAADAMGVKLLFIDVSRSADLEGAFETIADARADALSVSADAFMFQNREALVGLAARHKIAAIYPIREFAVAGGLVSHGTNYPEAYRQVGVYLGRVLNGEKPEDLPVEQVTKLQLVINGKTAKTLGLELPATLLARADEVIE